jgi:excisionase family DNA binding protein
MWVSLGSWYITVNTPIFASEEEASAIQQLDQRLAPDQMKLVAANGEEILIPHAAYEVLRQGIHLLASGQAISMVPHSHALTTQEAAALLNVSRPFLIKLLEQGIIPYYKVGSHRRIRFQELMAYKKLRDAQCSEALDELAQMTQEAGFYAEEATGS